MWKDQILASISQKALNWPTGSSYCLPEPGGWSVQSLGWKRCLEPRIEFSLCLACGRGLEGEMVAVHSGKSTG